MVSRELVIINRLGLHARAAVVGVAREVEVRGAAEGAQPPVTVHAEGDDAVAALEAVAELINDRFGEDE